MSDPDFDYREDTDPRAVRKPVPCECGAYYYADVIEYPRAYGSPGWDELADGEPLKCEDCQ